MNIVINALRQLSRDIVLKFNLGCHFLTQPRAKLATTIRLSYISRWICHLILKTLSSWPKLSRKRFLGSITENIVINALWQLSTASPTCRLRSCRRTMALRWRSSAQKILVSEENFSRAAFHSCTRRCSAKGSKQIPGKQDYNEIKVRKI
jgi:hypothetical protein